MMWSLHPSPKSYPHPQPRDLRYVKQSLIGHLSTDVLESPAGPRRFLATDFHGEEYIQACISGYDLEESALRIYRVGVDVEGEHCKYNYETNVPLYAKLYVRKSGIVGLDECLVVIEDYGYCYGFANNRYDAASTATTQLFALHMELIYSLDEMMTERGLQIKRRLTGLLGPMPTPVSNIGISGIKCGVLMPNNVTEVW